MTVLTGPTAVGKTELALGLAAEMNAEILSIDSRQVYRRMDIGTGKPTPVQRRQVPHHLLDLVEPDEGYSAGGFAAAAQLVLSDLQRRGRNALLVGGSGLYLEAVLDGLRPEPEGASEVRASLGARLREEGLPSLYAHLGRVDPAAAAALSPRDAVRILRALELALTDGRSRPGRWRVDREGGLAQVPLMLCLTGDRDRLYGRIDARVSAMLERGWVAEVEGLLAQGFHRRDPGFEGLGYGQIVAHLLDGVPLADTAEAIRRRTRQYAKRQLTWFRRDRRLRWIDVDQTGVAGARDRILRQWAARAA